MKRAQTRAGIDEKAMLADPASVFTCPEDVLARSDLTAAEKQEVLRSWAYDADELSVAEEEGMQGGRPTLLRRILLALNELGVEIDTERTPPTRHGGIARYQVKENQE